MKTRLVGLFLFVFVIIVAAVTFIELGGADQITSLANTNGGQTPVVWQGTRPPTATDLPTPTPTEELPRIVIAVQDIPRGAIIRPEYVALREWPPDALPFNAILDEQDVIGRHARTDIYVEQPILNSMVVPDLSDLAEVGSEMSATLPTGRVAVTLYLPPDDITAETATGDYVDVYMTLPFVDTGEYPNQASYPRVAVERIVQLALVMDMEPLPENTNILEAIWPVPVTLAVTPQQAGILLWGSKSEIPLTIVMRAASDTSQVRTDSVTLDYIIAEFGISVPSSQSYALQPSLEEESEP